LTPTEISLILGETNRSTAVKRTIYVFFVMAMLAMFSLAGCGTKGDSENGSAPPCESNSDCTSGLACVTFGGGAGVCTPTCSVSGDECSGSAGCKGVGALSVNVCQEEEAEGEAPAPEEQPKIPCKTDAECDALHAGAICAQWKGVKDCTIQCMGEATCDMPEVGGMKLDFMTCIADERTDKDRTACLPDEKCFTDPMSCVELGTGMPGMDFGDLDDGSGAGDDGGFGFGDGGDPRDF